MMRLRLRMPASAYRARRPGHVPLRNHATGGTAEAVGVVAGAGITIVGAILDSLILEALGTSLVAAAVFSAIKGG